MFKSNAERIKTVDGILDFRRILSELTIKEIEKIKNTRPDAFNPEALSIIYDYVMSNARDEDIADSELNFGTSEDKVNLALMYLTKKGGAKKLINALSLLNSAAKKGDESALKNLSFLTQLIEKGSKENLPEYQHALSYIFKKGLNVESNDKQAFDVCQQAAEQNDGNALYVLSYYYAMGIGCTKNLSKSFALLKRAADQNNPEAENALGIFYEHGPIDERDDVKAIQFYHKAAQHGHIQAEESLQALYRKIDEGVAKGGEKYLFLNARLYEEGAGSFAEDKQKAVDFYHKAGAQDCDLSHNNLAGLLFLDNPLNEDNNMAKAAKFCQLSLDAGNRDAQINLTSIVRALKNGSDQKNRNDQYQLAQAYENGWGVPRDVGKAIHLYLLAAQQNHQEAKTSLARLINQENMSAEAVQNYILEGDQEPWAFIDIESLLVKKDSTFFAQNTTLIAKSISTNTERFIASGVRAYVDTLKNRDKALLKDVTGAINHLENEKSLIISGATQFDSATFTNKKDVVYKLAT